MEKEIANQVQEAQRVPYRINPMRNTPRHILIKLTKTKHKVRILKAAREKQQVAYKGNPIRLTADLSAEALQDRREWQDILKVFKGKNLQPRLQYLARISFKIDGKVKNFLDKQKLREFRTTKPAFGEGNGTPLQYFCLENPMDGGACSPWGRSESDRTERLHFHFSLSCTGEGNGNPLQCSCLENPGDSGAWWAAIYGVAQSQTRLKRLSSSSSSPRRFKVIHSA